MDTADTADTAPRPSAKDDIARWVGRIGIYTTILTALVLALVLAGNLLVHLLGVKPDPAIIVLVDLGPLIGVFLGNIATGVNYYGTWRVLRGLDEYDVRDDAKSQVQNLPGLLGTLLRFAPALSAALLIASLIVSFFTVAPAHALGVDLQALNPPPAPPGQSTHHPPSSPSSPTPTHLEFALVNAAVAQQCTSSSTVLPAFAVTLDNSASNVDANWQLTQVDTLASSGQPWATADTSSGIVPAGQSAALTLTPNGQLCALSGGRQITYQALVQVTGADAESISDEIAPPLVIVSKQPRTPSNPQPPTPTPTIPPSQPPIAQGPSQPPVSPPEGPPSPPPGPPAPPPGPPAPPPGPPAPPPGPPAPPPVVFAPVIGGSVNHTQSCTGSAVSYAVTLDNTESTMSVTWRFTAREKARDGQPWASSSPPSGTIAAGQRQTIQIVVDPNATNCSPGNETTYGATITFSGGDHAKTITISDTITRPAPAEDPPGSPKGAP